MKRNSAEALLLITTAIWGSTFLIIKLLVGDGANLPFGLLSARFIIATITTAIVLRPKKALGREELIGGLIIGIAAFGGYAFQTLGLVHTTPAKSGFITSLFVLFVPLVSRVWEKKTIPPPVWIALIPAGFGLWAISGAGLSIAEINAGDKITFLSAISYTFQIVGIQVYTQRADWRWLTVLQFAVIAVGSTFATLFQPTYGVSWERMSLVGIVYLAVIASTGALGIQMFAQKFTTTPRASLIYIAEPIFAAGFAWAIMGFGMSGWELVGAGAIMLSMVVGRMPWGVRPVAVTPS
ncbi:MAG TPA: DMT family transporter [candidate division Zixibacteria bacterium]|nr:DMT family transporter [candidate division Zixibacteria bacterium]